MVNASEEMTELNPNKEIIIYGHKVECVLGYYSGNYLAKPPGSLERVLIKHKEKTEIAHGSYEERILAALEKHWNQRLREFHETLETTTLILDYIPGINLEALAKYELKNDRDIDVLALEVGIAMCDRLKILHTQQYESKKDKSRIIHRDIKPQNIIIGYDGSINLIDFSISQFEEEYNFDPPTWTNGSSGYMPPESLMPERYRRISPATDIWSLGSTIAKLFFIRSDFFEGTFPLSSTEKPHTSIAICSIEELERLLSIVPNRLRPVLLKCLAQKPEDRYTSADQLKQALQNERAGAFLTKELGRRVEHYDVTEQRRVAGNETRITKVVALADTTKNML